MKIPLTICIYLFLMNSIVETGRILGVFPIPERSHYILGSALMKGLYEKGHEVTMVSPFGEKAVPRSANRTYRDIVIRGLFEKTQRIFDSETNLFEMESPNPFINAILTTAIMDEIIENFLQHENMQTLIKSKEKFDVVIVEQFLNDAQKALATHFEAPLIIFSTIGPNFWINPLVGCPSPPSYVPDVFSDYSSNMTFFDRLTNSLIYVLNQYLYNFHVFSKQNKLIEKYIPNGPNIEEVLYNASLVLLNSHPSTNQPVPFVPSMIEIGGFHVQPPKPLPEDLQEFLDNAPNGVIYFSLGSNLKSSQLPAEKLQAILQTFSKLKQKVLWKWENDSPPKLPANVKTGKWFPQQDILAHPSIKLFITHGGLLSVTEAIYHGVPLLVIPVFGDQRLNAKFAANHGFGLSVSYGEISERKLDDQISKILEDPKYKTKAKERSKIFHDRLVSPMETAIYWVEYVVRYRGAPHLRVAGLDLPWYKYHLIDVIAFVILGILFVVSILYYILSQIVNQLYSQKKKVKKS